MIPAWYKRDHARAQNALLDRCTVLQVIGSRAIKDGQRDMAERMLGRIRRLESLSHYGSSAHSRITLAAWAIGSAVVASVLIRFLCFLATAEMKGGGTTAINFPQELGFAPTPVSAAARDVELFFRVGEPGRNQKLPGKALAYAPWAEWSGCGFQTREAQ